LRSTRPKIELASEFGMCFDLSALNVNVFATGLQS
jgi:hypothetical protein